MQLGAKVMWATAAAFTWFCFGTVAAVQTATNQPPPLVHITTNYYIFGGTNFSQMRASMVQARPWKERMGFDAHTVWDVHAVYRYARDHDQFKLGTVDVTTTASIMLPRWIPGKPVSWDIVTNWSRCFFGLSAHEMGHVQVAAAAGAEVRRRLQALPSFASAQELLSAADHTVNDTLEEFRQREVKYDETTQHGRTQGAVFWDVVKEDLPAQDYGNIAGASTNGFPPPRRGRFR